jgi:hypothetical protein
MNMPKKVIESGYSPLIIFLGPQAKEMAEMFKWFNEYTYFGKEKNNLGLAKKINPNMKTWKQFLQTTGLRTNPRR